MEFIQKTFSGGIDRREDSTKRGQGEYFLLTNGRVRDGGPASIKSPEEITFGVPPGKKQGLYSSDELQIIFVAGKAYYKNYTADASGAFTEIGGFLMSTTADRLYAVLLPSSYIDYERKLSDNADNSAVKLSASIQGSPAGVLVQDGINQPWIIFSDGSCRVTQTYAQWSLTNREYVPIGILPAYIDGILYLAGKDPKGKYNRILRSVTGRPLDFMVPVKVDGDKGDPIDENGYGAPSVAYKVGFEDITAIVDVGAPDGTFCISTKKNSYLVIPDLDNPIYGEPRFRRQFLFPTGAVNEVSVVELLGDAAFIDTSGLRRFNAVLQLKNEGRNSPFSRRVFPLLKGIQQTVTAAINFDNYGMFAVETIHGPGILVFDTLLDTFVSLDLFPTVGLIKQFSAIEVNGIPRLFFITSGDKFYEMYASTDTATMRLYFGDWCSDLPKNELKATKIDIVLNHVREAGNVQVVAFADRKEIATKSASVEQLVDDEKIIYENLPFAYQSQDNVDTVSFDFSNEGVAAWKLGFMIELDCLAMISSIYLEASSHVRATTNQREAQNNSVYPMLFEPVVLCITGNDGVDSVTKDAVVLKIKSENPEYVIGVGNHNYPSGAQATQQVTLRKRWDDYKQRGKLLFCAGNYDLDTSNGGPHFQYFYENGHRYFKRVVRDGLCELFCLNSGINTAGSIVEPHGILESEQQAQWLRVALLNSTAKWKFVFWNHPPYSSDAWIQPGRTELRWPLRQWGASALFCGRQFNYEHLVVDDFNYFNSGLGGFVPDIFAAEDLILAQSVTRYNTLNGYLRLEVNQFNARVQLKTVNGDIADTVILHG